MAAFAGRMKAHQTKWALSGGSVPAECFEIEHAWVLRREHRRRNLFEPAWWANIAGREHRWARSLLSSQCFAVNLFGPAAANQEIARAVLRLAVEQELGTDRIDDSTRVKVDFEHTPPGAVDWLGEKGTKQPTQVDVFFTASNRDWRAHLLVEVKLTEAFGRCRGPRSPGNPNPERCKTGSIVARDPATTCWLANPAGQGRRYWQILSETLPKFDFGYLDVEEQPCPFSEGLYQLFRNACLSRALVAHGAQWAYLAACIHPNNQHALKPPVAGQRSAVAALRALAGRSACLELDPRLVIEASVDVDPSLSIWADWMRDRYLLADDRRWSDL